MSVWDQGWLIGAVRMPGRNAGYRAGRCLMDGVVCHYTVGRDSRGPGLRGLFSFLIAKDGTIYQFAEVDAVCAHACEWNVRMTGVETEKLRPPTEEPTTPEQIAAWGRIAAGLREYGIEPTGYDSSTQRLSIGAPLRQPYTAHRSLVHRACDQHTDWLLDEEMAQVLELAGGANSPSQPGRKAMFVHAETGSGSFKHLKGKRWAVAPSGRHTEIDQTQWVNYAPSGERFVGDASQCAELLGLDPQ